MTTICDTGKDYKLSSPYYAEATTFETKPGCWNYNKVNIIERESKNIIGSYTRNYSNMYRTFHPFKLKNKWFALYSPNYTATRIMSLPDCKDIGGEEPNSFGFCPTDYFVPVLANLQFVHDSGCPRSDGDMRKPPCTCDAGHLTGCPLSVPNPKIMPNGGYDWESCICKESRAAWDEAHFVWSFPERVHRFIAGCIWGDDSSWKIQYLDLSQADKGIIKRDDRFGYIELPSELNLDNAIDLDYDDDYISLKIATQNYYNINGKIQE